MIKHEAVRSPQIDEKEWVGFPGGELEGKRPKALCPSCLARLRQTSGAGRTLCFQCYRADLDRQRAIQAAGSLDTASDERFQTALPFEAVNVARLDRLRAARATTRAELQTGAGRYEDRVRRAQIAARHALQRITTGLQARNESGALATPERERREILAAAAHAAELQLPDAWLPFVVAR